MSPRGAYIGARQLLAECRKSQLDLRWRDARTTPPCRDVASARLRVRLIKTISRALPRIVAAIAHAQPALPAQLSQSSWMYPSLAINSSAGGTEKSLNKSAMSCRSAQIGSSRPAVVHVVRQHR
jgi:hypothetical protein